jgi:hypothetical protein
MGALIVNVTDEDSVESATEIAVMVTGVSEDTGKALKTPEGNITPADAGDIAYVTFVFGVPVTMAVN